LAEYELVLRAFPVKDKVIVNLRITKSADTGGEQDRTEVESFQVRFIVEDQELGLAGQLPRQEGETIEVAESLVAETAAREIQAVVQIGEERRILSRKLEWAR
jgi:hypothetical protein